VYPVTGTYSLSCQPYIDNTARPTLSLSFKDALGALIIRYPADGRRVFRPSSPHMLPEGSMRDYLANEPA